MFTRMFLVESFLQGNPCSLILNRDKHKGQKSKNKSPSPTLTNITRSFSNFDNILTGTIGG